MRGAPNFRQSVGSQIQARNGFVRGNAVLWECIPLWASFTVRFLIAAKMGINSSECNRRGVIQEKFIFPAAGSRNVLKAELWFERLLRSVVES